MKRFIFLTFMALASLTAHSYDLDEVNIFWTDSIGGCPSNPQTVTAVCYVEEDTGQQNGNLYQYGYDESCDCWVQLDYSLGTPYGVPESLGYWVEQGSGISHIHVGTFHITNMPSPWVVSNDPNCLSVFCPSTTTGSQNGS